MGNMRVLNLVFSGTYTAATWNTIATAIDSERPLHEIDMTFVDYYHKSGVAKFYGNGTFQVLTPDTSIYGAHINATYFV